MRLSGWIADGECLVEITMKSVALKKHVPNARASGYRSPSHNRAVGGAPASKYLLGTAFNISLSNHDPVIFADTARAVGFLSFGTYPRSGFMHIDLGPACSLGEPFPACATPFLPEA